MSWDKYGSPYDPSYRGKMERPQDKREQERHRLRGCGDPECMMCNPELAGRGLGAGPGRGGSRAGSGFSAFEAEMMRRTVSGLALPPSYIEIEMGRTSSSRSADRQPESYKAARKEVEKWIATAPDQAFDDIKGNAEALDQLRDAIEAPVKHKAVYDAYGMKMPKGAMLAGPPGCGKTMFARAAAAEMKKLYGGAKGFEFLSISGSELQSPYIGVTEGHIKALFTFAREYKAYHGHPLLIFMDEADVLLPDRTGRVRRLASWEESQVATFLAEMDGMQESGAFVLLATNRPQVIDQAVLRDGRCDFKITVRRPDADAIRAILAKNFAGILCGADSEDQLVFAATEALFDPHKVIAEMHTLGIQWRTAEVKDMGQRHFLLEHIVSGAMAASVPSRAKRHAFARDKVEGIARGVTVADVLQAVNDLFEENKALDHSFALDAFKRETLAESGGGGGE